jgi:hypothetical protein
MLSLISFPPDSTYPQGTATARLALALFFP